MGDLMSEPESILPRKKLPHTTRSSFFISIILLPALRQSNHPQLVIVSLMLSKSECESLSCHLIACQVLVVSCDLIN